MPNADQMLHKVHFMAILTAFGQSFMQPDIMVFKQNLAALEQLNDKWKLYHKVTYLKVLELVCCKKWKEKVHDQLLVWGIGDV